MATIYDTTTTTVEPYGSEFYDKLFNQAWKQYQTGGPKPYTGQTVAPMSGLTDEAYTNIAQMARQGTPWLGDYQDMMGATFRGDYLDPDSNPWLAKTYQRAATDIGDAYQNIVAPRRDAQFAGAGRYGSGAFADASARDAENVANQLGRTAENIYGGAYQNERRNQLLASQMAPRAQEMGYYDAQKMLGVGQDREAYRQNILNERARLFREKQDRPFANLQNYAGLLSGQNLGGITTEVTPYHQSGLAGDLANAASVVDLINAVGGQGALQNIWGGIGSALGRILPSGSGGTSGSSAGWLPTSPTQVICHVARLVFGEENPEWIAFYFWKEEAAPTWFRTLYNRYAKPVAEFIEDKPKLQNIVRNWMRSKINRGQ